MPTNPYISRGSTGEQNLLEDIIIESIKAYGTDVYYLPRTLLNKDDIFLDDNTSAFNDAYVIEMFIENTDGFEGDRDLFTKFGVEIRDAATFICSRKRFKNSVGNLEEDSDKPFYRPREGDLIHLPLSGSTFQIMKVEDETPFYQLKNLPTFRMMCELFEYNDDDFDTGIEEIDDIEEFGTFQYVLTLDSAPAYERGETITQVDSDYTLSGEVVRWDAPARKLYLAHVGSTDGNYKTFQTGVVITGSTSGAAASPTLVEELQNIQLESQNDAFSTEGLNFIDFSENNPFGDIS